MKIKNYSLVKLNAEYAVLQMLFWSAAASAYGFLTLLLQFKGFSIKEIGIINSVKLLSTIFFQIIIGVISDKFAEKISLKSIISFLSLLSLIFTFILYKFPLSFFQAILLFIGFGATFTCISPLIDALSIVYNKGGRRINYVWARAAGSFAWAISSVLFGVFCDKYNANKLLIIQMILNGLMIILPLFMEKIRNESKDSNYIENSNNLKVHSLFYILYNYPKYLCFLIGSAVMFMGYNLGTTFLINVFQHLGGSNTQYGLAGFVLAISEVPSAYIFLKLHKKVAVDKMMVCCAIFMTIKTAFATYCGNVNVIIIAQSCEMLGFGLFYAGSVYLVNSTIPNEDAVKGVSIINAATVGVGEGIGSFLSGIFKENFGLYGLMNSSVLVSLISIIFMIIMCKLPKKRKLTTE